MLEQGQIFPGQEEVLLPVKKNSHLPYDFCPESVDTAVIDKSPE